MQAHSIAGLRNSGFFALGSRPTLTGQLVVVVILAANSFGFAYGPISRTFGYSWNKRHWHIWVVIFAFRRDRNH